MANVQVRIKNGPTSGTVLERVPSVGEYIAGKAQLFRIEAVIFTPGNGPVDAVVFAAVDADGKPDVASGFLFPHH